MTDLVERLRARKLMFAIPGGHYYLPAVDADPDCTEAAAEIERLREALVQADLTIRSLPGTDQSHVEFIRAALSKASGEGV